MSDDIEFSLASLREQLADAKKEYKEAEYGEDLGLIAVGDAISLGERILHIALEDRRNLAIAEKELRWIADADECNCNSKQGHAEWCDYSGVVQRVAQDALVAITTTNPSSDD